eukprot:CAMPEP_0198326366 /NCGR_PEP_ID=MMETSP1450-20131203/13912_1 /TAXON_ID=753684 ORGANISM="Madagascaria erythrocladiodes, Strain CCMP3234" /NCGR_SAMPLE_ID=MMETSP1450 /ASSEMBLY_ACC=CAM_ASM_001115 /LENGTH=437 /DNA_ID=CAMNT_0044030327 /DNA_START=102 /DNA_END=1412 /DNA_ORIENTATION=+
MADSSHRHYRPRLRYHFDSRYHRNVVVVGSSSSGGSWNVMHDGMRILSPAFWMGLPDDDQFYEKLGTHRARRGAIARYYHNYAAQLSTSPNGPHFHTGRVVAATRIATTSTAATTTSITGGRSNFDSIWKVVVRGGGSSGGSSDGSVDGGTESSVFFAKALVVATGMYDIPRSLGSSGELQPLPQQTINVHHRYNSDVVVAGHYKTVVVVGAGLSAADAIVDLQQTHHVNVIHVWRGERNDDRIGKFGGDSGYYPEYSLLAAAMQQAEGEVILPWAETKYVPGVNDDDDDTTTTTTPAAASSNDGGGNECSGDDGACSSSDGGNGDENSDSVYEPLPQATFGGIVVEEGENFVLLKQLHQQQKRGGVDAVYILIGSKPDLSFLPPKLAERFSDIDAKKNPIDADDFTGRVREPDLPTTAAPLFAAGPLVGENFVRFL